MTVLAVPTALELNKLLEEWMDDGRQFTCFDLTRELRRLNHTVNHQAVLDFVHGAHGLQVAPFNWHTHYGRFTTTFSLPDGSRQTAEVYRDELDSSPYDPEANMPKSTQPACSVCELTNCVFSHTLTTTSQGKVTFKSAGNVKKYPLKYPVDGRGRICVRKTLVDKLKPSCGLVNVLKDSNSIILNSSFGKMDKNTVTNWLSTLKVDKDGNVRIGRHLQRKAGLLASEYSMEVDGDKIVLRA